MVRRATPPANTRRARAKLLGDEPFGQRPGRGMPSPVSPARTDAVPPNPPPHSGSPTSIPTARHSGRRDATPLVIRTGIVATRTVHATDIARRSAPPVRPHPSGARRVPRRCRPGAGPRSVGSSHRASPDHRSHPPRLPRSGPVTGRGPCRSGPSDTARGRQPSTGTHPRARRAGVTAPAPARLALGIVTSR